MINLIAFFHTPLLSHKTNNTTTHHHTRTVFLRNNHAEMLLVLPILLHGTVTKISSSGLSSPVSTVTLSILPAPTDLTNDTEQ
jgi:hypothetical protein